MLTGQLSASERAASSVTAAAVVRSRASSSAKKLQKYKKDKFVPVLKYAPALYENVCRFEV